MERSILRLSFENFFTVALLSATAYAGVLAAQQLIVIGKARLGK